MTAAEISALHVALNGPLGHNPYYNYEADDRFNVSEPDQYQAYLIFWQLVALSEGKYLG